MNPESLLKILVIKFYRIEEESRSLKSCVQAIGFQKKEEHKAMHNAIRTANYRKLLSVQDSLIKSGFMRLHRVEYLLF